MRVFSALYLRGMHGAGHRHAGTGFDRWGVWAGLAALLAGSFWLQR